MHWTVCENTLWKWYEITLWNVYFYIYIYIHTLNDRSLLEFDDPLIRFQDLDEATREALHEAMRQGYGDIWRHGVIYENSGMCLAEAARSFAVDAMLGPASLVFPFHGEWVANEWDIGIFRGQKTENFVGFLRPETLAAAVVGLGAPGSLGGLSGLSAHLLDDMSNEGFDMRVESEWATVGWWLAVPQECKASGVEGSWLRCECILRRWIRRDLEAKCSWVRVLATHWTCKRYTYDSWQYGLCSVEWLLRMAFSKGSKLFPIAACLDVTSHVDLEWCYDHVSIMSLLQSKVSTHLVTAQTSGCRFTVCRFLVCSLHFILKDQFLTGWDPRNSVEGLPPEIHEMNAAASYYL